MVGYVELHMELVTITEDEHSKQQDAHRAFTPSVTFIAEHRNNFLDIYSMIVESCESIIIYTSNTVFLSLSS